jgi:hypothetical protein
MVEETKGHLQQQYGDSPEVLAACDYVDAVSFG